MNVRRLRAGNVRLSGHAYERWGLRVGGNAKRASIATKIKARIATELKLGAEVNRNGALEVEIRPGVWAICYPSLMGGWEVATIIREGWNGDMEERAMYGGGNNDHLKLAIEYFEDAIKESDEIIADVSYNQDLRKEYIKQKNHFVVALEAMRTLREAGGL